ncbi:hypothetical protein DL98DRAFT_597413 [Cadophora sp. DSE1049]|nr:hypothetical protein DL98DRAFT_597413 [Cadophora sp. DSE1049]
MIWETRCSKAEAKVELEKLVEEGEVRKRASEHWVYAKDPFVLGRVGRWEDIISAVGEGGEYSKLSGGGEEQAKKEEVEEDEDAREEEKGVEESRDTVVA